MPIYCKHIYFFDGSPMFFFIFIVKRNYILKDVFFLISRIVKKNYNV